MSWLSSAVGGIGKAVTAPIKSVGNILTGKANIGDLLSIGSLFAPGGNLFNLGSGGLASLGTANLGANLGTQGLLNSAGLGGFAGQGGKIDWIKGLSSLAGFDAQKLLSGHGSIQDYIGALQAIGTKSPELMKAGALAGLDFKTLLAGKGSMADYINAFGTLHQVVSGGQGGAPGTADGTVQAGNTLPFDPNNPEAAMKYLIGQQAPITASNLAFLSKMTPVRQNLIQQGVSEADPSRYVAQAQAANSLGQAATDRNNAQNRSRLLSQGVSLAEIQGMEADANNSATLDGNAYYHKAMDPGVIAAGRKDQISMLSDQELGASVDSLYNKLMALKQLQTSDRAAKAGEPNTTSMLMGLAGQWIGSGGLDGVFKKPTGTKNTETMSSTPATSSPFVSSLPTSMDIGGYNPLNNLPTKLPTSYRLRLPGLAT